MKWTLKVSLLTAAMIIATLLPYPSPVSPRVAIAQRVFRAANGGYYYTGGTPRNYNGYYSGYGYRPYEYSNVAPPAAPYRSYGYRSYGSGVTYGGVIEPGYYGSNYSYGPNYYGSNFYGPSYSPGYSMFGFGVYSPFGL